MDQIQAAATRLWQAQQTGQACTPVRDLIEADDIERAYAVQKLNVARGVAAGRRLVGRKIGLTARSVQAQLGVDQPDFGHLFADMARLDGDVIEFDSVLQPKVEAEIALVLAHDLPHSDSLVTDLIQATAYVLPALEIVGSRVANWDIRIADTIADNASCGLFVLGQRPVALADFDLRHCGMSLLHNGRLAATGVGAACLGHPLNAALWLANTMAKQGAPLRAGDIVLTGALGPMVVAQPGDTFEAQINGLGTVSTRFSGRTEGV